MRTLLWLAAAPTSALTLTALPRSVRSRPPAMKACTFTGAHEAVSPPFSATRPELAAWIASGEALPLLFSQADGCEQVGAADDGAQTWEIQTPIAFPGVVVRSVTTMNVALDAEAPALSLTSGESRTEAPGAPGWIAKLFDAIASSTVTDTSNAVTFRDAAGGGRLEAVSSVSLSVRLNLPGWVPLPLAQIEKSGSESLQKVLEKDMPAVLASFREGFLAWEARQS